MRRACRCIAEAKEHLPPFLLFVLFNTWLNGWCTAHRFQQRARCPFCKGHSDALEHLAGCPALKRLFTHHLGAAHNSFSEFLGIEFDRNRLPAHVLGLHAAKTALEAERLAANASGATTAARFRAALQMSVRKWPRTRHLVHTWTLCTDTPDRPR